jgi:pyridoxine 4-dehydrogenase
VTSEVLADESVGTVRVGHRRVRRLGYGAMRVSGARDAHGVRDRASALALVRRLVDRGVQFFDGPNIYGYGECEEILGEALRPHAHDVLIATKSGFARGELAHHQRSLPPLGRPEHIREECDKSLRRLGVDCIELYQVHVPDPAVPYEETVGTFVELQQAGKVRHIGVSNVSLEQLRTAQGLCEVVSVQNAYGLGNGLHEDVLVACEAEGIAFLPLVQQRHARVGDRGSSGRRVRAASRCSRSRRRGCSSAPRSPWPSPARPSSAAPRTTSMPPGCD